MVSDDDDLLACSVLALKLEEWTPVTSRPIIPACSYFYFYLGLSA